jgi:hypothetical protein
MRLLNHVESSRTQRELREQLRPVHQPVKRRRFENLLGNDDTVAGIDTLIVELASPRPLAGIAAYDLTISADDELMPPVGISVQAARLSKICTGARVFGIEKGILVIDSADHIDG